MVFFRLWFFISFLLLNLLSACSSVEQASNIETSPAISPTPRKALPSQIPTATNAPSSDESIFHGPLSVVIFQPADNATVYQTPLEITGEAKPGTVLSLNDEVILVDDTGKFQSLVPLVSGMNMIEITASDFQNNQDFAYMTVFLESEP